MSVPCVGLFHSPPEFRSYSMDRYAASLGQALHVAAGPRLVTSEFRPTPQRTKFPGRVGRYWSRYPRYLLQARRTTYAVNHVLDQAYAHLAYVLEGGRTIVTCHDIFPLQQWRGAIPTLARRKTPPITVQVSLSALRKARFVIAVSEATKDDLVRVLGLDPARIRVIHHGVDPLFHESPASRRGRPEEARILSVSTGAPYKNNAGAVEVLARVAKQSHKRVRLLRVGPQLSHSDREHAKRRGVSEWITELGRPSDAALADEYRSADVLLHPSFYEGFGWPPLEAMASGLPVVTSNWRSLIEVTDGAALHADADDHDRLAELVLAAIEDEGVAQRMRERGLNRARQFSWDKAASQVLELYATILAEIS